MPRSFGKVPPRASHGKLRHSDSARSQHFHSFMKQFYSGKTVAVKTCNMKTCTVVTGTLKGGKTNRQQRRFLANTFGFYTNCEHGPALPSVCCANVHTAHVQAGELRSCVHLHHLLPANRVTGESLSCLIPANGGDTAGISPDPACPHSSSGKGSCLPWFLPLTPLRALKARKVCRFVCFGVSNFTCMTV